MKLLPHLVVLAGLCCVGCSSSTDSFSAVGSQAPSPERGQVKDGARDMVRKDRAAPRQDPMAGKDRAPEAVDEAPVARKIIYTARVELVVESFDQAQKTLVELIERQKGYLANSEVTGSPGMPRHGTWTVRIPVANLRAFLTAVEELGEPQRNTLDSQDITDEYYDLEARVKNKKVEEERLLEHLKKSTGKLEDILAVEREITRVRGEIEHAQGRLQKLSKLSELTTVTITFQERKDYVPKAAPSFSTTIGRTFDASLDALLVLGKFLVLLVVAVVPWLVVLAVIGAPVWLVVRRSLAGGAPRRVAAAVAPPDHPEAT